MYGKWHKNSDGGESTLLRQSPKLPKACRECRKKKVCEVLQFVSRIICESLGGIRIVSQRHPVNIDGTLQVKCTGQITGCDRCATLRIKCTYSNERTKKQAKSPVTRREGSVDGPPEQQQPAQRQILQQDHAEKMITPPPTNCMNGNEGDYDFADFENFPMNFLEVAPDGTFNLGGHQLDIDSTDSTDLEPSVASSACSDINGTKNENINQGGADFSIEPMSLTYESNNGSGQFQLHDQEGHLLLYETQIRGRMQAHGDLSAHRKIQEPSIPSVATGKSGQPGCDCKKALLYMINDLETSLSTDNLAEAMSQDNNSSWLTLQRTPTLDSALASHRDALRYGESIRQCPNCKDGVETKVLLLLLVNRLIVLCNHMTTAYNRLSKGGVRTGSRTREPNFSITIGEYEVESTAESHALLREILSFQLRSLHTFVTCLSDSNDFNGVAFLDAKDKVVRLWREFHRDGTLSPL